MVFMHERAGGQEALAAVLKTVENAQDALLHCQMRMSYDPFSILVPYDEAVEESRA